MRSSKTLVFLFIAYVMATYWPQPGKWLRLEEDGQALSPKILLALLLFCAGICTSKEALRNIKNSLSSILGGLLLSWGIPLLAAVLVGFLFHACGAPRGVCIGIVIVASMPIANSSVGWSSFLGGNVATSIALLLGATALSPLITSATIQAGTHRIPGITDGDAPFAWNGGMSIFFIIWVFVPVLAGVFLASQITDAQSQRITPIARRISFSVLVFLNYLNGAAFLPGLRDQPWDLIWPTLAALSLLVVAFGLGIGLQRLLRPQDRQIQIAAHFKAIELAIVLRNTGAALVFAGAALPQFPQVSMTIIGYTMLQHIAVACFVKSLVDERPDESQAEQAGAQSETADDVELSSKLDTSSPKESLNATPASAIN